MFSTDTHIQSSDTAGRRADAEIVPIHPRTYRSRRRLIARVSLSKGAAA